MRKAVKQPLSGPCNPNCGRITQRLRPLQPVKADEASTGAVVTTFEARSSYNIESLTAGVRLTSVSPLRDANISGLEWGDAKQSSTA